ncbi:HrpJ domain-containing protein [Limnobacter alexandrii]|uniref:HrpJ domain-containing protein n=1 Tax=Limnobacter alexandrii TaxID=2570352 RepID=UPI0011081CA8|nr:HrpJ domain-containing protein [Limnobacter alexandrii]
MSTIHRIPSLSPAHSLNEAAADAQAVRTQAGLAVNPTHGRLKTDSKSRSHLNSSSPHELDRTHALQAHMWRHFNIDRLRSLYRSMRDVSDRSLEDQTDLLFQKFVQMRSSDRGSCDAFESLIFSIEEDPSKQYVIAVSALDSLYKDPDATRPNSLKSFYLKQLKSLALSLYEKKGLSVKAGLNSAKAIESALEISGVQVTKRDMRNLYRESLIDQTKPSGLVEKLLEKYKPEEFRVIVKALVNAVSEDLSSAACSDTLRVASALQSMKIASHIFGVLRAFEKGIAQVNHRAKQLVSSPVSFPSKGSATNSDAFANMILNMAVPPYAFKKSWQNLATDLLRLTGVPPSRELIKGVLVQKHLLEQYQDVSPGSVGMAYMSLVKKTVSELPADVFNGTSKPAVVTAEIKPEQIAAVNRYYWIDYIQDMYQGRDLKPDWVPC